MMKLRFVPLFLMMALASILGACETANREIPPPPVNQGESPQGGQNSINQKMSHPPLFKRKHLLLMHLLLLMEKKTRLKILRNHLLKNPH